MISHGLYVLPFQSIFFGPFHNFPGPAIKHDLSDVKVLVLGGDTINRWFFLKDFKLPSLDGFFYVELFTVGIRIMSMKGCFFFFNYHIIQMMLLQYML